MFGGTLETRGVEDTPLEGGASGAGTGVDDPIRWACPPPASCVVGASDGALAVFDFGRNSREAVADVGLSGNFGNSANSVLGSRIFGKAVITGEAILGNGGKTGEAIAENGGMTGEGMGENRGITGDRIDENCGVPGSGMDILERSLALGCDGGGAETAGADCDAAAGGVPVTGPMEGKSAFTSGLKFSCA